MEMVTLKVNIGIGTHDLEMIWLEEISYLSINIGYLL